MNAASNLPARHVWRHNFGHGLTCVATFTGGRLLSEWSRTPPAHNRGFTKAYVRWMQHVTQQAAEITGQTILQLIEVGAGEWVELVGKPAAAANASGESRVGV